MTQARPPRQTDLHSPDSYDVIALLSATLAGTLKGRRANYLILALIRRHLNYVCELEHHSIDAAGLARKTSMELDDIFMLVEPSGPELAHLSSIGLIETYRRRYLGQGTQNACFCFDNLFLECLWVDTIADIRSEAIARTGLYQRSRCCTIGANPFGTAWRDTGDRQAFKPASWGFKPPYLPKGMTIEVACDGDDPRQPMMFKSPGNRPPAEKRKRLQSRRDSVGYCASSSICRALFFLARP